MNFRIILEYGTCRNQKFWKKYKFFFSIYIESHKMWYGYTYCFIELIIDNFSLSYINLYSGQEHVQLKNTKIL